MTIEELYEATRGHWKVGPRARSITLVCAVYRGIIREVFKVETWHLSEEDGRSYFDGTVASSAIRNRYLHKSVSSYWKQGSQNPIKYVG